MIAEIGKDIAITVGLYFIYLFFTGIAGRLVSLLVNGKKQMTEDERMAENACCAWFVAVALLSLICSLT